MEMRACEGLKTFGEMNETRNVRAPNLNVKNEVYGKLVVPSVIYVALVLNGLKTSAVAL